MQVSHPRPDGLDLDEHTAELTARNNSEPILITRICASNVTTRLRHIPVGFCVAVKSEIGTKRTSNKPVSVTKDLVEWGDKIVLPSDRSSRIALTVCATFELGPTLGNGEVLCEFEATVGQLLDHQGRLQLMRSALYSDGEGDTSPLLSCEIEIERRVCDHDDMVSSNLLESEETRRLGRLTDMGHHALTRHRKRQKQRDLNNSIRYFKRAQDECPPNHFSRAVVLFNLATARLIHYRVHDTPSDLGMSIDLYRDALRLRPLGHPDHPFTLLSLGVALEARFQRQHDEADRTEGRSLLSQVLNIATTDSYAYHAAALALGSAAASENFETMRNSEEVQRLDDVIQQIFRMNAHTHALFDHLGILFCICFDRLGDLGNHEKAISALEVVMQFIPNDHPDKPSWLLNLSMLLLNRYEHSKDRKDLDQLILVLEDAMCLTPDGNLEKAVRSNILGDALFSRYEYFGDIVDLERSMSLREDAVRLTPDEHPDKSSMLSNLGNLLLIHHKRFGDVTDLERSISVFEGAVKLTPDGHPDKPSWLNNLGSSLLIRYQRFGDVTDLERSVSVFEDTVKLIPDGHPDEPSRLNSLGNSLLAHYEHFGDVANLERSISVFEDAVKLTPNGHPDKPSMLNNLGNSLLTRYEHLGDATDLERSISVREDAIKLTPGGHPDKSSRLSNLGNSFFTRYEHFGDVIDLERSISLFEDTVKLTPSGHPDKPSMLNNIGTSLLTRYERSGDVTDLERSISVFEDAIELTPDGHPDKPLWLSNLGNSLLARFERFGDVPSLEKAISVFEHIVNLTPDGHPDKPSMLNNLGNSFQTRYERFGDVTDLERSISVFEDAVELTADGHPEKPSMLNSLGSSLSARHERFGDVTNLEKSISVLEDAVKLALDGQPDRPSMLNNLGGSLLTRYKHFRDVTDLERSISVREEAVELTADGHPEKPSRLSNLGDSLSTRYEHFGGVTDLERSLSVLEDAITLTPDDHPDRPSVLNTLGSSLLTRYQRFGDVTDLERSISVQEEAVELAPDGHPDKPLRLSDLGNSLFARYECFGDVTDLERSISVFEDAVELTPDGHPDKPSRLNNFGNSLSIHYERFGDVADLKRSVSVFESAVKLTPGGHPDKPPMLNNLGNSFRARYKRLRDVTDLERSISMLKDAVELTHPDKTIWLYNLGNSFRTRYEHSGDVIDLERSISAYEDAVQLTPDGHLDQSSRLNNLASSLLTRFQHAGGLSSSDVSQAMLYSSRAARSQPGLSVERFEASQLWIRSIRLLGHDSQSLIDPYTIAIELLPQLAWLGLSLPDRYRRLLRATNGARDAAATALDVNRPALAVEWLEQGRSVVWSQFSQLRTPVDDLRIVYPELAAQLERVSRALEQASIRDGETPVSSLGYGRGSSTRHHAMALLRERLLAEIRALPGFERFLLPKTIAQLSPLARSGPVVFLNASEYRCDALVVVADSERVIHVPLSDINHDEIQGMQLQLNNLLRLEGRVSLCDNSDRGARMRGMTPDNVFRPILKCLWEKVVGPILRALPPSTSDSKLRRVFWCPTGPFSFLPIHAAGVYSENNLGPKLTDFVISSYVPTISVLELPPQEKSKTTSCNIHLLAVPQPSTDGQGHLSGVRGEINAISKLASSSTFVGFQEADGTVEDVLSKMTETDWVHFACHGTQDRINPYDSGFLLAHGKRLKITDIAQLSRLHGGLAFLSACQTAAGDEGLSEEAIHIAGGMLLAGYRGVIATMWSIMDNDAPKVTEGVYKRLFSDGRVPDSRNAAEALHEAVGQLRDSGASFLSWVPFIHVGL